MKHTPDSIAQITPLAEPKQFLADAVFSGPKQNP